jgi:hypothetical protein
MLSGSRSERAQSNEAKAAPDGRSLHAAITSLIRISKLRGRRDAPTRRAAVAVERSFAQLSVVPHELIDFANTSTELIERGLSHSVVIQGVLPAALGIAVVDVSEYELLAHPGAVATSIVRP